MGLSLWVPRLASDGKRGSQVRRVLTCPAHFLPSRLALRSLASPWLGLHVCDLFPSITRDSRLETSEGEGSGHPRATPFARPTARPGDWGPQSRHRPHPPTISKLQVRRRVPGDSRCCRSPVLIVKIWTCLTMPKINENRGNSDAGGFAVRGLTLRASG